MENIDSARKHMGNGNWKSILFSCLAILLLQSYLRASVVDKSIVKVNDDIILQSEYDDAVNPVVDQVKKTYGDSMSQTEMDKKIAEIKKELLDQMVDQKLLLQEAKKQDIKASKREVEDGIATVKDRFKKKNGVDLTPAEAESEFNAELKNQNLTMAKFRDKITEDIMVNKLIESEVIKNVVPPTDEELTTYFDKNRDKIDEPEKVSVRHILIRVDKNASLKDKTDALNRIKEIQKKLQRGDDFAKLAGQYSEDPGSKKNGGDLGFIIRGMMVKSFEEMAFKTPVGETSPIFQTEFGYHILKVDAKQAKQKRSFEDVKDNLDKYLLTEKRQTAYENYIKTLRAKANLSYDASVK